MGSPWTTQCSGRVPRSSRQPNDPTQRKWDRSPYKTHLGATFPWLERDANDELIAAEGAAHANGGYFNFQPGGMYVGGGMWMPEKPRLDAFRRAVVDEPDRVRAALEEPGFLATFGTVTAHDSLKRVPPGFPADHPNADLLRAKDVVFGRPMSDAEVCSPGLPDTITDAFVTGMPVFRLLATIHG